MGVMLILLSGIPALTTFVYLSLQTLPRTPYRMMRSVPFFIVLFVHSSFLWGQSTTETLADYRFQIQRAVDPLVVDGKLDEQSWSEAEVVSDFWMQQPLDGIKAGPRTEVRMTYDADHVYIAATCYDVQNYVVQTLERDKSFFEGDGFAVIIDPVNSRTNGFFFGISPFNVQSEDLLGPNAPRELTFSWDNRWFSAVTRLPDRYVVELAIPFKTLRFKKDIATWGINFIRNNMAKNEYYSWTPMPVNFRLYDLGYTGAMRWDKAPDKTGTNISLIPYVTSGAVQDTDTEMTTDLGMDAKVAITSSLNLDLTLNPDFSQVDVDVQQTNLTRFNLRFPEQRDFFLENNDLFTGFGPNSAKPIFTRRIGLDENNQPIPIAYGARLSGNLNPDFRIGLMNIRTRATPSQAAQNYSVGVFNQSLWERSVLRGYVTNRQAHTAGNGIDKTDFGRNAGMELNYLNESGTWNYFGAFHLSEKSQIGMGNYRQLGFEYGGRKWNFRLNYYGMEDDYHADMGFIPQMRNYDALNDTVYHLGMEHFHGRIGYIIRPENGSRIVAHDIQLRNTINYYTDWSFMDNELRLDYQIRFRNTSRVDFQAQGLDTRLLFHTGFTEGEPLQPGLYRYPRVSLSYSSDARTGLPFRGEIGSGRFYNGYLTSYLLELNLRRQPWGLFSLSWEQNALSLPEPHGASTLTLISTRSEINFSTNMFWTSFLQYNTQQENFNINSRLQWRYLPMSDFFVVYTYNYSFSPFIETRRNQALLLKFTYMFTI